MRAAALAVVASLIGGAAYYKVGTPVVRAYPSADGTMVVKLTLSRFPGFVAYLRTSGAPMLGRGRGETA